jgi:hypothetical protein
MLSKDGDEGFGRCVESIIEMIEKVIEFTREIIIKMFRDFGLEMSDV